MVNMGCFFPTCKLAYNELKREGKYEELRNVKLFKPPMEHAKFERWKKSIPNVGKELTHDDHLCELHFKIEDFVQFENIITAPKQKQWKKITRLKDDAIPSIFYILKSDLSRDVLDSASELNTSRNVHKSVRNSKVQTSPVAKILNASNVRKVQNIKNSVQKKDTLNYNSKPCITSASINIDATNSVNYESEVSFPQSLMETESSVIDDSFTNKSLESDLEDDHLNEVTNVLHHNLITYSKKNSKYFKNNRDSIRVISYPASLLTKIDRIDTAVNLNNSSSSASDDSNKNVTLLKETVDDITESDENTDSNSLKEICTFSPKFSVVSNNYADTKKRSLFSKETNNQTYNKLFCKKMKVDFENSNKNDKTLTNFDSLKKIDNLQFESFNDITEVDQDVEIVPVFNNDESLNKFDVIVANIKSIPLLPFWSYTFLENRTIIFMRWNDVFNHVIKQITLSTELEISVYVKKVRVEIDKYETIDDLEKLEKLLRIVENIFICEGFGDGIRQSEKCRGFVSVYRGRPSVKMCIHCKLEKSKWNKEKEKVESLKNQLSEIRIQYKELMKENSLLCKHVESCCGIQLKYYGIESTELGLEDIGKQ